MTVTVIPSVALVDDVVHILVTELNPFQSVTICAALSEDDRFFISYAFYVSDEAGKINLDQSSSINGTYKGVEPMGLFWSMKPGTNQKHGLRLVKSNVDTPFIVDLFVFEEHRHMKGKDDVEKYQSALLTKTIVKRFYKSAEVLAFSVRSGSIRGIFFLPPGDGPFPGVIDMFGSAGGLMTFRASLLASRGFAALALAYFDYQDLPTNIELHLEYFEEAIEWLYNHPSVLKNGIGMVAVSTGGPIVLDMATKSNKVRAVVCINGPSFQILGNRYYKGETLVADYLTDDYWKIESTDEGFVLGKSFAVNRKNINQIIKIEKAENAHFLFVYGGDDPSTDPSHLFALIDRLKSRGKCNYQVLYYPNAGHLIEPPYAPHCRIAHTKLMGSAVVYGGETKAHSVAQEDSWLKIQSFLRYHITKPNNLRQSNSRL